MSFLKKKDRELTNEHFDSIYDAMAENGFYGGRMLSGSKSAYIERYPERRGQVYFNACVFAEDGTQVWHGDLDLVADADKLQAAADACGQTFFVTPENPFRWGGLDGKQDRGFGTNHHVDKSDRERIRRFDPRG